MEGEDWHNEMGESEGEDESLDDESYVSEDDSTYMPSNILSHTMMNPLSSVRFENLTPQERGTFQNSPHFNYINWDHPDQEIEGLDVPGSWVIGQELYEGLRFNTKEAVQLALKHYSMKIHQTFSVVESKRDCYNVECPNRGEGCPWRMRAILPKKSNKWRISKWGGQHTCVNVMLSQDHPKLDSSYIASCIVGMVSREPHVPITLIQERIASAYGYQISYKKAWMAKSKAIKHVFGDWEESFKRLPRWLDYMQLFAPDSYYQILTDDVEVDNQVSSEVRMFHRIFWTFKQCSQAFDYCKPIIQIDGTWLYGKYRGTLLIATSQDGNSQVVPLAFAIVEGETLDAWSWFLAHIREHVTSKIGICLISDRHKSIIRAVADENLGWQPPNAYHVHCIRHIASNFNREFKNTELKNELISIGYIPCKIHFDNQLKRFRDESPNVQRWIDRIPKEKWSLAYDGGHRYGHMTTNLSEAVNKILKGTRNLPITALVKSTYARLVEYFVKRGGQAMAELASGRIYCQKLVKAMEENQELASTHQVRRYDPHNTSFEVEEAFNPVTQTGGQSWWVQLNQRQCQCGKFQAYHFPCSHAVAACVTVSISAYQYVDSAYTLQSIVNAYSPTWRPLGNEEGVMNQCRPWELVPDPTMLCPKGRPKFTRIRNEMDWRESQPSQKCGYCKTEGHNRKKCPQRPGGSGSRQDEEADDAVP